MANQDSVKVEFSTPEPSNQMHVYRWLNSIGHNPDDWQVWRGSQKLRHYDPVTQGEQVILKPVKKK